MKLCRLTNLTSIDLSIEDLGVHLPGRGSQAVVNADSATASKNLKEMVKLVRVENIPESRPMPIWPFIKDSPVQSLSASNPVENTEFSRRLDEINQSQKEILLLLRHMNIQPKVTTPDYSASIDSGSSDPMFIPDRIMPTTQEIRMKVRESEVDKSDMDSSKKVLRRLRQK